MNTNENTPFIMPVIRHPKLRRFLGWVLLFTWKQWYTWFFEPMQYTGQRALLKYLQNNTWCLSYQGIDKDRAIFTLDLSPVYQLTLWIPLTGTAKIKWGVFDNQTVVIIPAALCTKETDLCDQINTLLGNANANVNFPHVSEYPFPLGIVLDILVRRHRNSENTEGN